MIEPARHLEPRVSIEERNALVEENLALVGYMARRFLNRGLPVEDLEQAGVLGLMRAAEKFDATRGAAFSTYAWKTLMTLI